MYIIAAMRPGRKTTPWWIRFWRYVAVTEGCWKWVGGKHEFGYGKIFMSRRGPGRNNQVFLDAHRASWIIHFGPVPEGMCVLHKCDNPECTRPDHLELGTTADNNWQTMERERHPRLSPSRRIRPARMSRSTAA